MAKDEPQSYGSQKEWVTGKTGQKVNDAATPHATATTEDQGGKVSAVQLAESARATGRTSGEFETASNVTEQAGGAKRGGFFKDRDYK